MLIDWFTVGAQLLNFLVLVWLLKHFLYQPILNALDAREQKISAELDSALNKKQAAQLEYDSYCLKNQEVAQQRAELLKTATEEAKQERQRLLNEVQQEIEQRRSKWQDALKDEQQNLLTQLSQKTQAEVFAIARQTLADLADINLEQQLISVFLIKLRQQNNEQQQLTTALQNPTTLPLLRTAFDLSEQQRFEIEQAVQEIFAVSIQLQFKTAPHLISGIELSCGGQKISWSIADYLINLEKNFIQILQPHVTDKK